MVHDKEKKGRGGIWRLRSREEVNRIKQEQLQKQQQASSSSVPPNGTNPSIEPISVVLSQQENSTLPRTNEEEVEIKDQNFEEEDAESGEEMGMM